MTGRTNFPMPDMHTLKKTYTERQEELHTHLVEKRAKNQDLIEGMIFVNDYKQTAKAEQPEDPVKDYAKNFKEPYEINIKPL